MRVLLFNILFFAGIFLFALVGLIAGLGPGGQARIRWFLRRASLYVQWLVRAVLAGRIEIRGEQYVADRPALLVPKHQSELDVFIPLARYPDIAAVAMAELARYPLLGPVLRKLDYILVSVEGKRRNQLGEVMDGAQRVHTQGRPILIYPEGELMKLGARERYKSGVFHIYESLGVPAIPVAQSLGLIWPQRQWRKDVGQTGVWEFLEPIPPGLDRDTFMALLEERIESQTIALIREHGRPEIVAEAEARHAARLNNHDQPVRRSGGKPGAPSERAAADPVAPTGNTEPKDVAD